MSEGNPSRPRQAAEDNGVIGKGERKILTAVAQYDSVDTAQLTVLTGYKETSRRTYLQRLSQRGLVVVSGDRITATAEGLAAVGDFERLPTGAALRRYWLDKLSGGEKEILQRVCEDHPRPQTRDGLMEVTGYRETSMRTYLQRLAARKLVVVEGNKVQASAILFD